jgi:hypothetical protein
LADPDRLIFLSLRATEGSVATHSGHCEAGTAGRGNPTTPDRHVASLLAMTGSIGNFGFQSPISIIAEAAVCGRPLLIPFLPLLL